MEIILGIALTYAFIITVVYLCSLRDKPNSYEISNEQFNKFISQYYPNGDIEDFDLCELVEKFMKGEAEPHPMRSDGLVEAVVDCEGAECPASPAREDCCNCMGKDGKCHFTINLNKICNVKPIIQDPSLLTEKEAKDLADAIARYYGED
jgi:hypothetical protein